jgi:hypothetical protein
MSMLVGMCESHASPGRAAGPPFAPRAGPAVLLLPTDRPDAAGLSGARYSVVAAPVSPGPSRSK